VGVPDRSGRLEYRVSLAREGKLPPDGEKIEYPVSSISSVPQFLDASNRAVALQFIAKTLYGAETQDLGESFLSSEGEDDWRWEGHGKGCPIAADE